MFTLPHYFFHLNNTCLHLIITYIHIILLVNIFFFHLIYWHLLHISCFVLFISDRIFKFYYHSQKDHFRCNNFLRLSTFLDPAAYICFIAFIVNSDVHRDLVAMAIRNEAKYILCLYSIIL